MTAIQPSAYRIFLRELRYETLRMLRTRSFSLSVIGFPVMFYALFALVLNRGAHVDGGSAARYLLAGYASFGAVGAALFGVGVPLAAELGAGWLALKRAGPMPPAAYLLAKCGTAVLFAVAIVGALAALGSAFGGVTLTAGECARLLLLAAAGALPFAALGLLMAVLVPANAAPGVTNLLYLPMSFLGGLWIPISLLPAVLRHSAPVLPTYHLAQLMLGALAFPAAGTLLGHALYLLLFTAGTLTLAAVLFKRREENR